VRLICGCDEPAYNATCDPSATLVHLYSTWTHASTSKACLQCPYTIRKGSLFYNLELQHGLIYSRLCQISLVMRKAEILRAQARSHNTPAEHKLAQHGSSCHRCLGTSVHVICAYNVENNPDLTTTKHTDHLLLCSSGVCASIVIILRSSDDSLSTTYRPGAHYASTHAKEHVL